MLAAHATGARWCELQHSPMQCTGMGALAAPTSATWEDTREGTGGKCGAGSLGSQVCQG